MISGILIIASINHTTSLKFDVVLNSLHPSTVKTQEHCSIPSIPSIPSIRLQRSLKCQNLLSSIHQPLHIFHQHVGYHGILASLLPALPPLLKSHWKFCYVATPTAAFNWWADYPHANQEDEMNQPLCQETNRPERHCHP